MAITHADEDFSSDRTDGNIYIPSKITDFLPTMVRTELSGMSAGAQQAFVEEFERKSGSLPIAYLCSLLYCHYGYLGRWGLTAIMWIAALATFGLVGVVWWIVDLFRMPGLVRSRNQDIAIEVLRNMRAVHQA